MKGGKHKAKITDKFERGVAKIVEISFQLLELSRFLNDELLSPEGFPGSNPFIVLPLKSLFFMHASCNCFFITQWSRYFASFGIME